MLLKDEGYVLSAKKYGEKALIVTLFSRTKGKIVGFVSDGNTQKNRALFMSGNKIFFELARRLEESMPKLYRVELMEAYAVMMMSDAKQLALMSDVLPMMVRLLNENEEDAVLYDIAGRLFAGKSIYEMLMWYAYFEFYALSYLGIPLALDCCAVTGKRDNLAFVSPKTGKAVCRDVGEPYSDKLFKYPHFIVDKSTAPSYAEIFNVLNMTEFFLKKHFFKFHNIDMPESRALIKQCCYELKSD